KSVAGNHPERVSPAGDGTIRLEAATAAIYGPTLTFDSTGGNLGSWSSAADRAAWSFQVERPATFTIAVEWACADETAGNGYELRIGPKTLRSTVGATGSRYRSIFVGEVDLGAGAQRLELRPTGPPRGALLDLRAVVLTPRSQNVFNDAT